MDEVNILTKECSRCLQSKPIHEYTRKDGSSTGARCRACRSETLRAWRRGPVGGKAVSDYLKSADHKASQKEWIARNQEKHKAHKIMSYARRRGKLVSKPCEVCGDPKSESHHEDYAKPLEVVWLCAVHHKQADAKRRELK